MKLPKRILAAILLIYFIFIIIKINKYCNLYQWDFKKDYYAAKVHEAGLNFYDQSYLRHFARSPVDQYYAYTPISIWFFRLFALFNYRTSYTILLILKCFILLGLVYLWKKEFLHKEMDVAFYVFFLLAFNGALYVDLLSGNVSLIEQFGLWLAFYFFLKKKLVAFCLSIVLISVFKVVPLFFLLLLFLSKEKKKHVYFLGSIATFLILQLVSHLMNPLLLKDFLRVFSGLLSEKRGITNSSTYVFLNQIFEWTTQKMGITLPRAILLMVFLAIVAGVIFLSWQAYTRLKEMSGQEKEKILIFLTCLAYALIIPRFKDYSYTLLIVPAYFALKRFAREKGSMLFFVLMILTIPENANPPGFQVISKFAWNFYPLALAYAIWILYLYFLYHPAAIERASRMQNQIIR